MALLSKAEILAADDRPVKTVPVPEWGGDVTLKTMSGSARDRFEASIASMKGDSAEINREHFRAKLLAACIVDEKGDLVFDEIDIPKLGQKSAKALDRLVEVAMGLNGISKADQEELVKN